MKQEDLKKIGGGVLVVASVGLGFWFFLALADVLTFFWAFWHFNNVIEGYGTIDQFVRKGIAAVLAGLIVWFMHKVVISIVKRNRKWVPIVVGIMIAIYAVMYLVSWPYHGMPMDTQEGTAAKQCYKDQYGVIQTIGLGAKAGPYGETVRPCTAEDAQELQRQTGGPGSSFLDGLFGNRPEAMALHADVEQIEILPDKTILHFAVKRINNFRSGRFYQPHGWDYLSDEIGQTYDLQVDGANYPDWVGAQSHKDYFTCPDSQHALTRVIRPDEVYRFTGEYAPLKPNANHLRLHDSRFGETDLDYMLAQGKATAQAQAQAWAVAQQEAEARAQAEAQASAVAQQEAEARTRAQVEADERIRQSETAAQTREAEAQARAQQAQTHTQRSQTYAEVWAQARADNARVLSQSAEACPTCPNEAQPGKTYTQTPSEIFAERAQARTEAFAERSRAFREAADERSRAFAAANAERAQARADAFAEHSRAFEERSRAFREAADERSRAFAEHVRAFTQARAPVYKDGKIFYVDR